MVSIKMNYRSLNAPYKCLEMAQIIFDKYATLTDAARYFCASELEEIKKQFTADLMQGEKQQYIKHLLEQIEGIKPSGMHGAYDFKLIREYEEVIKEIELF